MKILVTGSAGFMGKHLCLALRRQGGIEVLEFDLPQPAEALPPLAAQADFVFHLAGVNRPKDETEFMAGNADLTRLLCDALAASGRKVPIAVSSSIQAEADNPYGRSKKAGEGILLQYHQQTGAPVFIYRFPNVFGKWSRPNYNTVVATFCHNISRGLPVQLGNRANVIRYVYIDDIIREFLKIAGSGERGAGSGEQGARSKEQGAGSGEQLLAPSSALHADCYREIAPTYTITLGELHDLLVSFHENRRKSLLPDLSNPLVKYLYSTYVSFLDKQDFAYPVEMKRDDRGWLFELVKSPYAGQIFVSRTKPGVTRGNHYHDTKIEKFCVIQGQGVIRFRPVLGTEILEYAVNDQEIKIVDIPPGYAHSIENTGGLDMITLFWANEIFDPAVPDVYPQKVLL